MKLYRVTYSFTGVVWAKDRDEAAHEGTGAIVDEDWKASVRDAQVQVLTKDNLPPGWDLECIPYSPVDGETLDSIGDLLERSCPGADWCRCPTDEPCPLDEELVP